MSKFKSKFLAYFKSVNSGLGCFVRSFITKRIFPYIQNDKPTIKGNNALKVISL